MYCSCESVPSMKWCSTASCSTTTPGCLRARAHRSLRAAGCCPGDRDGCPRRAGAAVPRGPSRCQRAASAFRHNRPRRCANRAAARDSQRSNASSFGSEERRSHAHPGRAFLDRDFEVVRHAHGQFRNARTGRRVRAAAQNTAATVSASSDHGGTVISPVSFRCRDARMASTMAGRSAGFAPDLLSSSESLTSIMASSGFASASRRAASFSGIDRIDGGEKLRRFFRLVRLQMPDQMESRAGQIGNGRSFAFHLLHVVFAEIAQARLRTLRGSLQARRPW